MLLSKAQELGGIDTINKEEYIILNMQENKENRVIS
jgi:hypothetical protein